MKIDLSGKIALITGGSRGLGEAMAHTLGAAGATLALVARDQARLEKVRGDLAAKSIKAAWFACNVNEEAEVKRMAGEVAQKLGAPQIVINGAGTNLRKAMVDYTLEEFRGVVDSSLISTFLVSRAFVPGMMGTGYGRIINMTSMLSHVSLPQRTPYSSAKTGLLGFNRALALELAPHGITVNGISPGPIGTEMNAAVMNDPVASAKFLTNLPVGRWGKPEEIAGLACYLCSDLAGFITGTDIVIDGGWTAA